MTYGEKLKELRGEKSIGEVSDALFLSPDTYMAYERGDREPMPAVKESIAGYYGVSVSHIFSNRK